MNQFDRITQNPAVMGGKPCIRGLRVTVGVIVGQITAGVSIEAYWTTFPISSAKTFSRRSAMRESLFRNAKRTSPNLSHRG
jgi:uncharacterized protein (DUF433 family)